MKKATNLFLAICLMFSSFCLVACGSTTSLVLSTENNTLTIKPGETLQFATEIKSKNDSDKTKTVTYQITAGGGYSTISATGLLTVAGTATPNDEISIVSKLGDIASNKITLTVAAIPLESITVASMSGNYVVKKGGFATLTSTLFPENTTDKNLQWVITEGASNASIEGNKLFVNEDATAEAIIKVKAMIGNIESNVLTFNVTPDSPEAFVLTFNSDTLTIDKNDTAKTLSVVVYDESLTQVKDKQINFAIEDGAELIELIPNGYSCGFKILGHGTAIISATINGTNVTETATINTILPPTALKLPEVFNQRSGSAYQFSNVDALPFAVNIIGTNVCQDVKYTFEKDGVAELNQGDIATYANGEITFNTTGNIRVIATSKSGSKLDVSTSYNFNINEGINAYSFEDLKTKLTTNYNGEIVNLVALTEITAGQNNYDFVPKFILDNLANPANQTFDEIFTNSILVNGNVTINGNNHTVDVSKQRIVKNDELIALNRPNHRISSLFIFSGNTNYTVNINNMNIKGNCPVDFTGDLNGSKSVGVHSRGIEIGSTPTPVSNLPTLTNVNVTGFNVGIRATYALNGLFNNVTVGNCYSNGIESSANIIEFKNMTYGKCGAAGIELTSDNNNNAGATFTEAQQVTFSGTIKTTNYNAGDSLYFQNYSVAGNTIPMIINGLLSQYAPSQITHAKNAQDEFNFIAFKFNEPQGQTIIQNSTVIKYDIFETDSIINLKDIPDNEINTTHKYIILSAVIPGLGDMGEVLLYNHNYIAK